MQLLFTATSATDTASSIKSWRNETPRGHRTLHHGFVPRFPKLDPLLPLRRELTATDSAAIASRALLLLLFLRVRVPAFPETTLTLSSSAPSRPPRRVSGRRGGRGVSGSGPADSPDQEVASFRSYDRRKSFFRMSSILSSERRDQKLGRRIGSLGCVEIPSEEEIIFLR